MIKIAIITIAFMFKIFCNGENRNVGDFDQIVLTQRHPITAFWMIQRNWPIYGDRPSSLNLTAETWESLTMPSKWIIHELWPWKSDGDHPRYCNEERVRRNRGRNRNPDSVQIEMPLKSILNLKWPCYSRTLSEACIWNTAWQIHGKCMTNLPQIENNLAYFIKALHLIDRHNIGTLLERDQIFSGQRYSVDEVVNKIVSHLDAVPFLKCVVDESTPDEKQYLYQASVCFNKEFQFEQCRLLPTRSNCNYGKPLHIPELLMPNF